MARLLQRKLLLSTVVIILGGVGYYAYQRNQSRSVAPRYVTAPVTRGTLTVSLSGTGQVSVSNQVDVKPKASGDVARVAVVNGQKVTRGTVLVQLDATSAQKAVRDAQANLESTELALAKLKQPADDLSILQATNALAQATQSKQTATDNVAQTIESAFNTIANTFLNLPNVMAGLQDALLGTSLGTAGQWNKDYYVDQIKLIDNKIYQYSTDASDAYQAARSAYDANYQHYKSVNRSADNVTIESLLNETYTTTKVIATAVKSTTDLIQFYNDKLTERSLKPNPGVAAYLANLNTYTGQTNTALTNLLSAQTSIQSDKDTLVSLDQSIAEKTASLAKLKAGADPLDVQSQELSVQQRRNALLDAQTVIADYTVRAPFDGIMASVTAKVADSASTGTAIGTLITTQHLADITLNEVDVAKVKLGQKATLTFDAIDSLSLTGEVADIANLGTVSQGVVSYDVKIGFDTQDDRIKTGMSVAAAIITNVDQDVLLVPGGAVKIQGGSSYVQVLENGAPVQHQVRVVLANDTMTEVTGDVKEGDQVVTQVITSTTTSTQSSTRATPGGGLFGGAVRFGGVGAR